MPFRSGTDHRAIEETVPSGETESFFTEAPGRLSLICTVDRPLTWYDSIVFIGLYAWYIRLGLWPPLRGM